MRNPIASFFRTRAFFCAMHLSTDSALAVISKNGRRFWRRIMAPSLETGAVLEVVAVGMVAPIMVQVCDDGTRKM